MLEIKETGNRKQSFWLLPSFSRSNERDNQEENHVDFQAQTKSMPLLIPGSVERHSLTAFNIQSKKATRQNQKASPYTDFQATGRP